VWIYVSPTDILVTSLHYGVWRKAQCNGLVSVRPSVCLSHTDCDSLGAACYEASVYFGPTIKRFNILVTSVIVLPEVMFSASLFVSLLVSRIAMGEFS